MPAPAHLYLSSPPQRLRAKCQQPARPEKRRSRHRAVTSQFVFVAYRSPFFLRRWMETRRTQSDVQVGTVKLQCAELQQFLQLAVEHCVLPCRSRYNSRNSRPNQESTMAEPSSGIPPSVRSPEDRLDSWKEIAAYLNRDVTTVQR